MIRYLGLGATLGFAAAVQPGPLQTYLITRALAVGWRRAIAAAFAPIASDGPIIVLVLFILTRLPRWMERGLRCAGGVFLLYLAFGAFRSWRRPADSHPTGGASARQSLLRATLVNLLNPNPYLGWSLVMGPLFLRGWRESPERGAALLLGFYGTIVVCLSGIIVLFALSRNLGPRVSRALVLVSAAALAGLALYQLWMCAAGFWSS
jgi:threonine/homoserine/homoserine lactone efflux protein